MPAKAGKPPKGPVQTPAVKSAQAAAPSGTSDGHVTSSRDEQIRQMAYRKWEAAGKPHGDDLRFWLQAEREVGPA